MVGDLAAVEHLLAPTIGELYPGGRVWLTARLREVVAGDAAAYVCVDQPAFGADVMIRMRGAAILTPKGCGRMKLSTVYVHPDHRAQGVGSELMRTTLWHADRAGTKEIWVTVAHRLVPELSPLLYRNGFIQTAVELDRYGPGRDEAIFTRLR